MAHQTARAVKSAAKGDAKNTGAPGPTPAPVKKYVNPPVVERQEVVGYGGSKNLGPSSTDPGVTITSPLADELRRVAALSDAGDLLGDIAQHGTARNVSAGDMMAPQTRDVPSDLRNVHPNMTRQTKQSSKPGDVVVGTLPATCGATSAAQPVRKPQ